MLYYLDDGFQEQEKVAIATKNFECKKFLAVADFLESIFRDSPRELPPLVKLKMQTILKPYMGEIEKIRNFADKMLIICNYKYLRRISAKVHKFSTKGCIIIQI